ncbi:MAG: metal ABC transporter substrate-binding protein [Micromonosporaceae bacterium]
MRIRTPLTLAALLAAGFATAGCGSSGASDDTTLSIVTAFYPMQFVAERVAGEQAEVTNLTKPGVEPHDLELTAVQAAQATDADLIVYIRGFQPAVDEHVEQHADQKRGVLDVASAQGVTPLLDAAGEGGHEHGEEEPAGGSAEPEESNHPDEHGDEPGGKDPHLWLDPVRYAAAATAVAGRLGEIDPDHKADYAKRAEQFGAELGKLDKEYTDGLATCQRREIFASHAAFGYIAARYKLEQIALAGLSPEQEPNAKHLAEVSDEAKEHGATVIFFETLVSPKVAKTLAAEVGAEARVLDPIEGLKADSKDDYFTVMRHNLDELRNALGCS